MIKQQFDIAILVIVIIFTGIIVCINAYSYRIGIHKSRLLVVACCIVMWIAIMLYTIYSFVS